MKKLTLEETLAKWARAYAAARTEILKDLETEACVDRMLELEEVTEQLEEVAQCANTPTELARWVKANQDLGCYSCWLSSSTPLHQECGEKIKEFCAAESALYKYAKTLYPTTVP